jgi:phosphatidate phosphatase LPIN
MRLEKPHSDDHLRFSRMSVQDEGELKETERTMRPRTLSFLQHDGPSGGFTERSNSPPPLPTKEAIKRAISLSKQLSASNIPSQVTETGDLMLDMTGYKSSDDDALRAEVIARKILSEELEGNYDIGALIGADEHGNLWIYSSEEAKEAATQRAFTAGVQPGIPPSPLLTSDVASDPGYHSEGESETVTPLMVPTHRRSESEQTTLTPPQTPPDSGAAGDPNRNYAKTLRLTSDQLKALKLNSGPNPMSFTVNRATCQAYMYLWRHDVPTVISDIDGTITKSDALGHVLNMIGRDWTHIGVAKLYTEIVANGYNIMYLTSRSVGQADTTRAYLNGVLQDGYRLPKGPTIMSPDRTIAALRRELYIRKPEVFKMACLRDIRNLFGLGKNPFYAGFGNRLTDALSYRSVSIPSNRIFTINSNAEVLLDLLSLNKLKLSYVNMREVVDHYFPPVSMLVKGGGEEFTDFTYWRDTPLELEEFSASEDEEDDDNNASDDGDQEDDDDEGVGEMGDSYISHGSVDDNGDSILSGSVDEYEEDNALTSSMIEAGEQAAEDDLDLADQDSTQVLRDLDKSNGHVARKQDDDAAIITGMKTIALEKNNSQSEEDII